MVRVNNFDVAQPVESETHFADIESTMGRAGLRIGTSVTVGNLALQPFATASIWHEFEKSSTANLNIAVFDPAGPVNGVLATNRVGTYGQYALGLAGSLVGTGWLGYIRADYRDGDRINGWSVNGGLRYQFNPVGGSPMVTKGPAIPAPAPYNWTGFYLGGNLGTAFTETRWLTNSVDTFGFPVPPDETRPGAAGILGGGQIGYNIQTPGNWVFGLEFDAEATNQHGSAACPNSVGGGFYFTCTNRHIEPLVSLNGRIGKAWNRWLVYAKGGVAGPTTATRSPTILRPSASPAHSPIFGVPQLSAPATASDSRVGGTVGAGVEYGLTDNWSAKVEYNHYFFGTKTVTDNFAVVGAGFFGATYNDQFRISEGVDVIKVGVNYRFAPSPMTRY